LFHHFNFLKALVWACWKVCPKKS